MSLGELVHYFLIGLSFGAGFTLASGLLQWLGGIIAGSAKRTTP